MIFGLKFPLLLINFTGTLGYSIVLPFLVFLITEFGGNPIVTGLLTAFNLRPSLGIIKYVID
jgi:hypothetical protein